MKVVSTLVSLFLWALISVTVQSAETPPHLAAIQWGSASTSLPAELSGFRAVALMRTNALTVDAQGNIQLWTTQSPPPAALVVPSGLSNVVDVALGDSFAAALKKDGTVTCWGDITNSPASAGLSNVTQIAAGSAHLLALTANGEVIAWGNNDYGQASVPSSLSNVIAIAASLVNSLAVQADGHAVGWGGTSPGQFDVLQTETNTAAIATGPQHTTLLRKNGSVASFSRSRLTLGATNVPPGLTNVVAIAAGNLFSLALDADGAVVSWGAISPPPAAVHDAAAIYASSGVGLAWVKYPVIGEFPTNVFAAPGGNVELAVPVHGEPPLHYQWLSNGIPIEEATQSTLSLTNIDVTDEGLYSLTVSNASGVATSPGILLRIGPPTIVSHPEGTVATVGSTLTLTVDAVGLAPLSYTWLYNGAPIPNALENTLVLSGVQYANTGDYQAVVTNSYGAVTSSVAHVEISILDQQQTTSSGWAHLQRDMDRCLLAQTFTPLVSGRLVQLSLNGFFGGVDVEFPTTISIFDAEDGRPGTNLLGRAVIPRLSDSHAIQFDHSPVYLVAGTEYAFVLETEAPAYNGQSYRFVCGLYDPYPNGKASQKVGNGPWLDLDYPSATSDLVFWTYMVPGIPAVRLTSPAEGTVIKLGETVPLTAVASELESPPFTLGIYADGIPLGFSTNSPVQINWSPTMAGQSELLAILTNGSSLTFTSAVVHVKVVESAPDNDRFADRVLLTNDYHIVAVSNACATRDPGEAPIPSSLGASVWWQWTAPRSGEAVVAIEAPQDTNAVLGVYRGTAVDALLAITNGAGRCAFNAIADAKYQITLDSMTNLLTNATLIVALNDVELSTPISNSTFYAPALVPVQALRTGNQRQLTRVDLFANGVNLGNLPLNTLSASQMFSDSGYYTLSLASTDDHGVITHSGGVPIMVRPSNDDIEAATVLTGRNLALHASNLAATKQATDPKWADNQGGHSIWYLWTAPMNGICTIDGSGTNFALLLNVCLGSSVTVTNGGGPNPGPIPVVAANAMDAPHNPVQFDVIAGATYYLSVDGYFGEQGVLDWSLNLHPYNDDFSDRRVLTGLSSGFLDFNDGASVEPDETSLAPSGSGSSLWYSWQAPLPGIVSLQVLGTNGLAVAVYNGDALANLSLAAQSTGWTTSPTVTFEAQSGQTYQIAVFGQAGSTGEFSFNLAWKGLRFVSPLPNTVRSAPANLTLALQLDLPGKSIKQTVFKANGSIIGTVTNAPFALNWAASQAGTYTLSAQAVATDDSTYDSVPVTCLLYSGDQMPRPRVYAGVQSDTSYVINAVGALHLFGANAVQFGRTAADLPSTPFLAKWPMGETGWKEISGSWAIANSGKLYQNGVTLIPFPTGVTAWQHVSRGFNGGVTVGDNGDLYYGGTTRIEVTRPPGGWKDARASLTDVNNIILGLGEDHEAYVIASGPYGPGDWSAGMLTRPAGVNGWKSIAQAALFGVLLTDNDDLWIYGEYGGVTGTSDTPGFSHVPLPEGVTHWVDFAAGGFHVLAIGDNGQLYAWGRNWEHQLGIGLDQNPRATPVKVDLPEGVSGWSSVAAGYFHSIAIGLDCSLYAWGENAGGQAGQPPSPPLSRPFRVGSLEALCGTPVLFTDGNTSRLPDGSFRLEFNSDLNRSYLIQYSDDLRNWKNATSAITGTGELVTWIDDGPPKTDAHPATVTTRTYRVVYAP